MEAFITYLEKKKIDSDAFKKEQTETWEEWVKLFSQLHEASFTAQKLFLINNIRRKYPLQQEESQEKKTVKRARPIIKR